MKLTVQKRLPRLASLSPASLNGILACWWQRVARRYHRQREKQVANGCVAELVELLAAERCRASRSLRRRAG